MDIRAVFIPSFAAVMCSACASAPRAEVHTDTLDRLAVAMTGTFDSSQQAADDESFYNIRLVMLPIWTERHDGPWLYVEQAVASSADRPYRQRVYRLVDLGDGELRSDVYTLPGDPLEYAGAWETGALDKLTPDLLEPRDGCSIELTAHVDGTFSGSTNDSECASSLRGAAYATSEVTITPDKLISWDRGWDANDQQVWGAEKGGYIFVKQEPGAPTE